ncbi:hypothetical protein ACH5RR_021285 [Cinchona calisaya]|uniref:Uncharacterized protein n=1 Tax=Cinchona calisaya TaxID=153742 RepID=A0ABD2ZIM8_9GENT
MHDALRHISYLCVQELPGFSSRKNHKIKAVIIGVVVSLDQQVDYEFRNKVPAIVDIQVKLIRLNDPFYTKTLYLLGVPDTNEDELYLCRFHEFNQLVFMLEDGDKLEVLVEQDLLDHYQQFVEFQGLIVQQPPFDFRDEDKRKTWRLGKHFHPNLKIVEFVGWHGLQVDTELAMFIIEHAVLQKVTINPRNQRVFDEELLSSTEKEEEIEEVARERARQLGNCSVSCCCIT